MAEVVRWGILGAGKIAKRFAASLSKGEGAELVAVAGRTLAKAEALAADYGARVDASYEDLIEDPEVDVVYVCVPHGLHAVYSMAALEAGKAVLCEKPATLSAASSLQVIMAAQETGSLFVEAMKPRFQPVYQRLMGLAATRELGELESIDARIAMTYPEGRDDYFADPVQGGVLLDLGTYAASWLDALTVGDPVVEQCSHEWRGLVDISDDCELTLGGIPCHLACSAVHDESVVTLAFEQATLEISPLHRPTDVAFHWADGRETELSVPYDGDDFTGEIVHVSQLVREGAAESPVMPLASTVRCARILDACASGFDRLGVAVTLGQINGDDAVFLNEPMEDHTTFELGGPADVYVEPTSVIRLEDSMGRLREAGAPAIVIGNGSDLLVSDAGIRGVVVSTARLQTTRVDKGWIPDFGVARVYADAGVSLKRLAELACDEGLGGLEFAAGIPGSVGGAIFMNAGAYDGCIADVLESAMVLFPDGRVEVLKRRELDFGYRRSRVRDEGLVVLTATFLLPPRDPAQIRARMDELWELRTSKQPLDLPSAGSTFKRPEGHFAGKLIGDAGLKGRRVGGAQVSEKHAGFVVKVGEATAQDVHTLIEQVIAEVEADSGVTLEPEVRRLGRFA